MSGSARLVDDPRGGSRIKPRRVSSRSRSRPVLRAHSWTSGQWQILKRPSTATGSGKSDGPYPSGPIHQRGRSASFVTAGAAEDLQPALTTDTPASTLRFYRVYARRFTVNPVDSATGRRSCSRWHLARVRGATPRSYGRRGPCHRARRAQHCHRDARIAADASGRRLRPHRGLATQFHPNRAPSRKDGLEVHHARASDPAGLRRGDEAIRARCPLRVGGLLRFRRG